MLKTGMSLAIEHKVRPEDSAKNVGSGLLDVYSTPAMIALMEKNAMMLVQESLAEGQGTVGISVNIRHLKASRIGADLTARATLVDIDDRKLGFELEVYEGDQLIGDGKHQRFIIDEVNFLARLD